jgi:twitching motility protein PilT
MIPRQIRPTVVTTARDAIVVRLREARGEVRFDVMRLLRRCADSGGSALFLLSNLRPSIRINGDIVVLDDEEALGSGDIQTALIDFIPEDNLDAEATTYARDIADVGRVRCRAMRDRRGPGVIFTMMPATAVASTRVTLQPRITGLCNEAEGVVIVCGARASGKSTLVAALIGHMIESRRDYVIALEERIQLLHESEESLVSQREVAAAQMAAAIHAALCEEPGVLVVDELRSVEDARGALEAATGGRLVICVLTAPDPVAALEQVVDMFTAEERPQICRALATALRGVVAQRLVRRVREGRSPARAVLLSSPGVSALVAAGRLADLKASVESL